MTSHTVTLNGLSERTLYHFKIKSKDACGNETVDSDRTFGTSGVGVEIPWDEAVYHIGEWGTVCGPVVGGLANLPIEGSPTAIDLGASMMMSVIISKEIADQYPLDTYWMGKEICATGDITRNSFTGGPQIIVNDISQIYEK